MYNNSLDYLNKLIQQKIAIFNENHKNMACRVLDEKDGLFIDVELIGSDNEPLKSIKSIENVMVMQSVNYSPCLKKGDIGFLWDIKLDLTGFIDDVRYSDDYVSRFFIFIPLLKKSEFQSNAKDFFIQTNEKKTKLVLNDESVNLTTDGNVTNTIKGDISISGEKTLKAELKDAVNIKGKSITIEGSGTDPLQIKNNVGSLKAAFDAVFQAMDGLAASAATSTGYNPSAYEAAKPLAEQMISKIVE